MMASQRDEGDTIYIRWDRHRPRAGQRSTDYITGQTEPGLSAVAVPSDGIRALAEAVGEYGAMYSYYSARCWVLRGHPVGRDSDGATALAGVQVVREITGSELTRLLAISACLVRLATARARWLRTHLGPPRTAIEWREALAGDHRAWAAK